MNDINPKAELWDFLLGEEILALIRLQRQFRGHERYYVTAESFDTRFEVRVYVKEKYAIKMEEIFCSRYPGIYTKPDRTWNEYTFEHTMKKLLEAKEFLIDLINKDDKSVPMFNPAEVTACD